MERGQVVLNANLPAALDPTHRPNLWARHSHGRYQQGLLLIAGGRCKCSELSAQEARAGRFSSCQRVIRFQAAVTLRQLWKA
jgi:hypothetical protein